MNSPPPMSRGDRRTATMWADEATIELDLDRQEALVHVKHGSIDLPDENTLFIVDETQAIRWQSGDHGLKPRHLPIHEIAGQFELSAAERDFERDRAVIEAAFALTQGRFDQLADPKQNRRRQLRQSELRLCQLDTEIHSRYALACSCLFFVLVGSPLAVLKAQSKFLTSFLYCFVPIVAGYYPLVLGLMTPVVKGWISEACLKSNELAIQVLGGYGYTRDFPVEQYYRDQRLNPIHEGTDGIQAIDLAGRKMTQKGGEGWRLLRGEIATAIDAARPHATLAPHADRLSAVLDRIDAVRETVVGALGSGRASLGLANASYVLDLVGLAVMGWMWLWQGTESAKALAAGDEPRAFYEGKLQACRYVFRHEIARADHLADLVQSLDDTTLAMRSELF